MTKRELAVLELFASGRSTKEVGACLGIGQRTVKWHLANATRKLSAVGRTNAVAIAVERNIVHVTPASGDVRERV